MTGLYLAGLGAELGTERLAVSEAVAAGLYPEETAERDGYLSLSREPRRAPYEMALEAARAALDEAMAWPAVAPAPASEGTGALVPGALVYASIHRHGQPRLWSPASWLQRQLGLPGDVPAIAVQQGCNGLMQAMILLAPQCRAHPRRPALCVGADRFEASGFDRWRSDYGLLYGDGAAAVALSASGGFAKLLHLAIEGVPALEEMHRDQTASPESPDSWIDEYDVRRSKKAFLARYGTAGFTDPLRAALERLKAGLLANPGWTGRADWLFTPFVGANIRVPLYETIFGPLARASGWEIGRTLGHLGTIDGWAGLARLREAGLTAPGDRVLILAAGVGFSCGLALIEFL